MHMCEKFVGPRNVAFRSTVASILHWEHCVVPCSVDEGIRCYLGVTWPGKYKVSACLSAFIAKKLNSSVKATVFLPYMGPPPSPIHVAEWWLAINKYPPTKWVLTCLLFLSSKSTNLLLCLWYLTWNFDLLTWQTKNTAVKTSAKLFVWLSYQITESERPYFNSFWVGNGRNVYQPQSCMSCKFLLGKLNNKEKQQPNR